MSTENNTNEQSFTKRHGPDLRFVIGLTLVIIFFFLLIISHVTKEYAISDLKDRVAKLEKELQNGAPITQELKSLKESVENFTKTYESIHSSKSSEEDVKNQEAKPSDPPTQPDNPPPAG